MEILKDKYGRVHDYLRLSVTDKCNFRCFYCHPDTSKECNTGKSAMLSYKELIRIIEIFSEHFGFKKFRFTGGEPLVRKGFVDFLNDVKELKKLYGFEIGLTTNGFQLSENLEKLKLAGVDRINISLDTLQRDKFREITKTDVFERVIKAIQDTINFGFSPLKINTVIMKGINDNEINDFVLFAAQKNINVRFIEYMPFADNNWSSEGFLSYGDILKSVEKNFTLIPYNNNGNSVAKDYGIIGSNGIVSFISSISKHFCGHCNRLRISSNGEFRLCLFADDEKTLNFKQLFKTNISNEEIAEKIQDVILTKWEKHPNQLELKELKTNNMIKIGG